MSFPKKMRNIYHVEVRNIGKNLGVAVSFQAESAADALSIFADRLASGKIKPVPINLRSDLLDHLVAARELLEKFRPDLLDREIDEIGKTIDPNTWKLLVGL